MWNTYIIWQIQKYYIINQTEDGQTKIDVRLEEEMVWLSQVQIIT
ncbi:hypothetical protein NC99_09990 [Sunxiuqinia dokdonensis]|uniref:Uncharacterized protein n=1 Tax=Sunxiuqinia dokdonensis TaxID=1409788 RepID=A0A0L8VCQ0_9BACT|nr:hypothetical protein NC99_09990 [Sunxiuqinia dokdonensis]